VIPCYNHAAYLLEALGSVERQTVRRPITVTIVDDGSTDGSGDLMRTWADGLRNSWIRPRLLFNERSLRQSGALNRAIASSANDLIVILNADDMLVEDCLAVILETYRRHSEIALLGGRYLPFTDAENLPEHLAVEPDALEGDFEVCGPQDVAGFTHPNSIDMSQSSCSFFRAAWALVGGYRSYRERVVSFDDRDFQMRVCAVLPIGYFRTYPLQYYRTSSGHGRGTLG
jgi:glycosyltransferase involved in cell wall biosynthesis